MLYPARQDTLRVGARMRNAAFVSVTAVNDTNIYAAADLVGGLLTFDLKGVLDEHQALILDQVLITDLDKQGADFDLLVFKSNPSGTTFTENAALDVADADLAKLVGFVQITGDALLNDNGAAMVRNLGLLVPAPADPVSRKLYCALVDRTTTPTYTTTSALVVTLGFRPVPV